MAHLKIEKSFDSSMPYTRVSLAIDHILADLQLGAEKLMKIRKLYRKIEMGHQFSISFKHLLQIQ